MTRVWRTVPCFRATPAFSSFAVHTAQSGARGRQSPWLDTFSAGRFRCSRPTFPKCPVQFHHCCFPPPADGADADLEQLGHLGLRPTVIEDQPDHLALLDRKLLNLLMEQIPAFKVVQVLGAVYRVADRGKRAVDELSGVVSARSVGPEEVACQVEQLA